MDDHVLVRGKVRVRKNGVVVYEGKNLVVNAGLTLIAKCLEGSGTAVSHMAVGDDVTTPVGDQTALVNELFRVSATVTQADNSITVEADFTGLNSGGDETVREFGIFNASSAGEMLCRFICQDIAWVVDDTLVVDWTINIGDLA